MKTNNAAVYPAADVAISSNIIINSVKKNLLNKRCVSLRKILLIRK